MNYTGYLKSTWKKALISSIITLPLFGFIFIKAIEPYWPANIIGWVLILGLPVILEVFGLAFFTLVYEKKQREEEKKVSIRKVSKSLLIILPASLVIIITLLVMLDFIKENYFVQL